MANRFPVIANSDIRRLEELASGDNLNLSGSGIYDGSGVGTQGQQLYSTGSGVEWADQPIEYDTLYSISAVDGDPGKQIIRLTSGGPLASAGNITDDVTLVAGSNVTLSRNGDEITIASSYVDTDTVTQVRGNTTGTYVDGQITLIPQGAVFINQNGNNINIGSTDTNTVTQIKGGSSGTFTTGSITLLGTNATSITQNGSTITVDSTNTITTVGVFGSESLTGDIILNASGATSLSQNGQNITINSVNTTYGIGVQNIDAETKAIRLSGSDNTYYDANLIAGTGISLSSDSNNLTISVDTTNIDLDNLGDVSLGLPVNGHILQYLNGNWINGLLDYSNLANAPALSDVATSGSYNDLSDTPALGAVATSNSYNDLNDLPSLVTDASDLSDTTNRFFSGDYTDLTNAPVLSDVATSGSYNDLTDTPSLATVATSGDYTDLSNAPTIPPERNYNISTISNVNGAAIRLNESVSSTNDDIVVKSGTGISISQENDVITISNTLTGIPTGVGITATGISFDGSSTGDGYSTTLAVINPTATRTLNLPNENGTLVTENSNKTYRIDVTDSDTNYFESKLGLFGSNTGGSSYSIIAGKGGIRVDSDVIAGGVASNTIPSLTIQAPPTVYTGSSAPGWAKDGDLWYNNSTGVLYIFDETLYPVGGTVLDYFQSVDIGEGRFFADSFSPGPSIPTSGFIVGPGIPSGANIISNFQGNATSAGWFNLNVTATAYIPHNAKLRIYATNPNFNTNNLWRILYTPVAAKRYLQNRNDITGVTEVLTSASGQNINLTGPKSYALLSISTDVPAWITIYSDTDSRTSDANRNSAVSPTPNTGVIADIHTTVSNTIVKITPGIIGWTTDNSNTIPIRIVNESGSDTSVNYTIKVLQIQGED